MPLDNFRNNLGTRVFFDGVNQNDQSPYAHVGTLNGTALIANDSLTLDGNSDYLSFPDSINNSRFGKVLTLGAWIRPDVADSATRSIISKYDRGDSNLAYLLNVNTSNGVSFSLSETGSTVQGVNSVSTISADTDYFIVATWDGEILRMYFNGIKESQTRFDGVPFDSNEVVSLGCSFNAGTAERFFSGQIYQAFILDRALSANDIFGLYLKGRRFRFPVEQKKSLLLYEPLDRSQPFRAWRRNSGSWTIRYDESIQEYYLLCQADGTAGIRIPSYFRTLNNKGFDLSFKMYKGADANTTQMSFVSSAIAAVSASNMNGYQVTYHSAESLRLSKRTNGSFTSLMQTADAFITVGRWNQHRVTYLNGQMTMYFDGQLLSLTGGSGSNPVTDTAHRTPKFISLEFDTGDRIADIQIRRF